MQLQADGLQSLPEPPRWPGPVLPSAVFTSGSIASMRAPDPYASGNAPQFGPTKRMHPANRILRRPAARYVPVPPLGINVTGGSWADDRWHL